MTVSPYHPRADHKTANRYTLTLEVDSVLPLSHIQATIDVALVDVLAYITGGDPMASVSISQRYDVTTTDTLTTF